MTLTCQSSHVTSLVDVGYDLVEWLMERLQIEESTELLHLASLLCQSGYFFPVADSKSLVVKDDGGLYRFQVRAMRVARCLGGDTYSLILSGTAEAGTETNTIVYGSHII